MMTSTRFQPLPERYYYMPWLSRYISYCHEIVALWFNSLLLVARLHADLTFSRDGDGIQIET